MCEGKGRGGGGAGGRKFYYTYIYSHGHGLITKETWYFSLLIKRDKIFLSFTK